MEKISDLEPCPEAIQAVIPVIQIVRDAASYLVEQLAGAGQGAAQNGERLAAQLARRMIAAPQKALRKSTKQAERLADRTGLPVPAPQPPPPTATSPAAGATITPDATCRIVNDVVVCGPPCPPGQHWDGTQCVPDEGCPPGWITEQSATGAPTCVPPECPPGQHWDGTRCVPDETCQLCYVYKIIRPGMPFKPGDCGIAIGRPPSGLPPNGHVIWGPSSDSAACQAALGACKRGETPPPPPPGTGACPPPHECPPGQVWSDVCQQCVVPCQPGYHWEKGVGEIACQCVPDHECPPGQHWDGTQCVSDDHCPPCDPCPSPCDQVCPPPVVNVNVSCADECKDGGNGHLPPPPPPPPETTCCPLPADLYDLPAGMLFGSFADEYRGRYFTWLGMPDPSQMDSPAPLRDYVGSLVGPPTSEDLMLPPPEGP